MRWAHFASVWWIVMDNAKELEVIYKSTWESLTLTIDGAMRFILSRWNLLE